MNPETIKRLLSDTDYPHSSATAEERRCAGYLLRQCRKYNSFAHLEKFTVPGCLTLEETLTVDGKVIPCRAYIGCGNADVEAPLYFLHGWDSVSLSNCADRVVIADGYPLNFRYEDIVRAGARALICYEGNAFSESAEPAPRPYFYNRSGDCPVIPAAVISARDALKLFVFGAENAGLHIRQELYTAQSQNVVADFPGETGEYIVCTAHYDTTPLSHGAYDNMSGCLALLNMMDALSAGGKLSYGIKAVFTGCEEIGTFGAMSFLEKHAYERDSFILNVNADMLGAVGEFQCVCSMEEADMEKIRERITEARIPIKVCHDVYSGDSSEFVQAGIPAVTFTRFSSGFGNIAPYHNSLDKPENLSLALLTQDIDTVTDFILKAAGEEYLTVTRSIPDKIKDSLAVLRGRKRPEE